MPNPRRLIAFLTLLLTMLSALATVPNARADEKPAPEAKAPADEKKDEPKKEVQRRPLLWIVEGTPRIFLYGTIHVTDARVTTHLPVVKQALDQSTALYTELRMDAEGVGEMRQRVGARSTLPQGQTLTNVLGADLHARVAKVMPPSMQLPLLENRKPWLINLLLVQEMLKAYQTDQDAKRKAAGEATPSTAPEALDALLFRTAQQAGKKVGGLETIDTQLDIFDNLSPEAQVKMVKGTVEQIESLRAGNEDGEDEDPIGMLLDLWLAGDDAGFHKLFEEDLRKQGGDEKKFVEALLDNRNVGMVKKILSLAQKDPKQCYFVAVGAGHMPGEKGIVKLLESAGKTVKRVELDTKLPAKPGAQPKKKKEPVGAGG